MSLVLELPPDLESDLAAQASRLRIPLAEYALRVLAGAAVRDPKPVSGADLVAYWKQAGVIGARPEITDAAEYARDLRQRAEKR